MGSWNKVDGVGYYRDVLVNAPTGTKSLLFNFGASHGPGLAGIGTGTGFARVQEVQAFSGYTKAVNLDLNGSNGTQATPVNYTGAGVAGGGVWNGYSVYSATGANVTPAQSNALQYSDGSNSTVKFALSETNPDNQAEGGAPSHNALMDDYVAVRAESMSGTNPTSTTFTLSGLDVRQKYSLYLYGNAASWGGCLTNFTVKNTTKGTNGNSFDGIFAEGRDYVKFDVKAGTGGIITGNITSPSSYGILNGFQLVENGEEASIHEANLLRGKTVETTSEYSTYGKANILDGEGGDGNGANEFVFGSGDSDQRMIVHGVNSGVGLIRVWTGGDLAPTSVTIKSSTSDTLGFDNFDGSTVTELVSTTALASTDWQVDWEGRWYHDFTVNAAAGTQSLFFGFGNGNIGQGAGAGFARIQEIQAFAAVPEPAAITLFVTGVLGLLAYAWRKRR
jgi:hypothetical protein